MVRIFLDSGHGGSDSGAIGNGLKEKDLTLHIVKEIGKYLGNNYTGFIVKLSRLSDKNLTLQQRTDLANKWKADLFVSVHINAGGGTGYEDYIHSSLVLSSRTSKIRDTIHKEITDNVKEWRNRGKKKANFHVLRESKMSSILTENGFIDSKNDSDKLKDKKFLNKIAKHHAIGIAKAMKLKKKVINKPVDKNVNTFHRVVSGSFNDLKHAEARKVQLKKAGFDSFIDIYRK